MGPVVLRADRIEAPAETACEPVTLIIRVTGSLGVWHRSRRPRIAQLAQRAEFSAGRCRRCRIAQRRGSRIGSEQHSRRDQPRGRFRRHSRCDRSLACRTRRVSGASKLGHFRDRRAHRRASHRACGSVGGTITHVPDAAEQRSTWLVISISLTIWHGVAWVIVARGLLLRRHHDPAAPDHDRRAHRDRYRADLAIEPDCDAPRCDAGQLARRAAGLQGDRWCLPGELG